MKKIFLIIILTSLITFSQWQPDVRLTYDTSTSLTSNNNSWCVAANGNIVHVVWQDKRDLNYEIYYKRSTDAGVSWGTDTRLTNNSPGNSGFPSVSVSSSVVHVVWMDNRNGNREIFYKRSPDGGISWGADILLTNDPADSWYPSASVSGSVVHVVWYDYRSGNNEIYYKRSTDGGLTWGADTRITYNPSESNYPSVAVSSSVVHVVWNDARDPNTEIYYKRSTDAGISWGADIRLTNSIYTYGDPSVAVSGSVVHVVWRKSADIYHKRSTDGGISWGTDTRLSTTIFGESWYPSVAVLDSVVHVVWESYVGNREIYAKRSTNSGISWGTDTRLTNNSSQSLNSSVSASGSVVHVVWMDQRDVGNGEIYYKRDPAGNFLPPLPPSNLTAYTISSSRINLNWIDNSHNETGFKIERSTNSTNWLLKDSVGSNIVTYADTGLTGNTVYFYRVYSYNPTGVSAYSNIAIATTLMTGVHQYGGEIPKEFKLNYNYPNPFNPSTKIKFAVPPSPRGEGLGVRLIIYDALGREVQTLVNEALLPGTYEVDFPAPAGDGSNFSSGVYYYTLIAGDPSAPLRITKKMVLIK